ncbi:hypothetical protein CLHUN_10050 [Ruminiclostridium hungatei]|uniref:Type I restriction enzyme R protein N-terminal domain-containing protein n=1 Tax=Ruminiclostridium hungatei TaxID=48256 RepID=A0A1V4SMK4_RUMHU|nr:hypothetical protein [Ruminiclostridium hungatei]OPX45118.1 hypothetical protein CLHUN_10050 [Ruminiclostridium hungatei]
MNLYQIKRRINIAIDTLRVNDNYLLINDVNERSIAHKLAVYMEQTFGRDYDIDCEYNRNSGDIKKIKMLVAKWVELYNPSVIIEDDMLSGILVEKTVFPDIIVHKRGNPDENLLVIEVKKSTSSVNVDFDIEKLKCYTEPGNKLNYKYGAFIKFHTSTEQYQSPDIRYFKRGKEISAK